MRHLLKNLNLLKKKGSGSYVIKSNIYVMTKAKVLKDDPEGNSSGRINQRNKALKASVLNKTATLLREKDENFKDSSLKY